MKHFRLYNSLIPFVVTVTKNQFTSSLSLKISSSLLHRTTGTPTTTSTSKMSAATNTQSDAKGAYKRNTAKHRHVIELSSPSSLYAPERNRYHLHVALACPWACGTLAMLKLKGLEDVISYSVVHPTWGKTKPDDDQDQHHGWVYRTKADPPMSNPLGHGSFTCDDDALIPDPHTNARTVREIYESRGQDFTGPYSTPLLYDTKTHTLVNNESTEILKMLNSQFNEWAKHPEVDLYPNEETLANELQQLNDNLVYPKVNNGVYRCGFARSQEAYDEAVQNLFEALDILEKKLSQQRYLGGAKFTWLDLRLFMTLVRFDPVYITYFKTNQKRLVDYPNLLAYTRDIYSMEAIQSVINMQHIKTHYFTSHPVHNTFGIIPVYDGPDLTLRSGRENM